jgi:hypothetical protein
MIEAIRRHKKGDWKGKDVRYIPYPANWLRDRRWEDGGQKVSGGGANSFGFDERLAAQYYGSDG